MSWRALGPLPQYWIGLNANRICLSRYAPNARRVTLVPGAGARRTNPEPGGGARRSVPEPDFDYSQAGSANRSILIDRCKDIFFSLICAFPLEWDTLYEKERFPWTERPSFQLNFNTESGIFPVVETKALKHIMPYSQLPNKLMNILPSRRIFSHFKKSLIFFHTGLWITMCPNIFQMQWNICQCAGLSIFEMQETTFAVRWNICHCGGILFL